MGEDLSAGARFAISVWLFVAVVFVVIGIQNIIKGFTRNYETATSSKVNTAVLNEIIDIANYPGELSGASYFALLSKDVKVLDYVNIVIDGNTYSDYTILLRYPTGLFKSNLTDNTLTITKVGDL